MTKSDNDKRDPTFNGSAEESRLRQQHKLFNEWRVKEGLLPIAYEPFASSLRSSSKSNDELYRDLIQRNMELLEFRHECIKEEHEMRIIEHQMRITDHEAYLEALKQYSK